MLYDKVKTILKNTRYRLSAYQLYGIRGAEGGTAVRRQRFPNGFFYK